MHVFPPLKSDNPLITDGEKCTICKKVFCELQRTVVMIPSVAMNMEGSILGDDQFFHMEVVAHATCALVGKRTPHGSIEYIKDGDASPYPVVTDKGQFKLDEVGLE